MYSIDINSANTAQAIVSFIREQTDLFERDGAVLGVSGGIDSATVATLAARSLGPENVLALLMPERDSSPDSRTDALVVIEKLSLPHRTVDLAPMLSAVGLYKSVPLRFLGLHRIKEAAVRTAHSQLREQLGESPFLAGLLGTRGKPNQKTLDAGNAYARAKHRARMLTLYYHAEQDNRLVLGTANRSEALSGFVVKWGDNVADIEPILPLFKTQVRQLATYLDVPQAIIDKPPTPDLIPGITDELALGLSYTVLDQVLYGLEYGDPPPVVATRAGVDETTVATVGELMRRSAHMRELPPIPEL